MNNYKTVLVISDGYGHLAPGRLTRSIMTAHATEATRNGRPHVLIVDDESFIRNLLRSILEDKYDCTTADSAESALSFLHSNKCDLVISDIKMGGMSGIDLVTQVTTSSQGVIAMLISGNETIDSPIEAIRSGAYDYIKKPFEIDQVKAAVDRAIAHSALMESKRIYEDRLESLVEERSAKLNYLAYHDPLTSLANRVCFENVLNESLLRKEQKQVAVIFASLDRFKELRNIFGHEFGDLLLRQVGRRLQRAARGSTVARLEGDEFALLMAGLAADEIVSVTNDILENVRAPLLIGEHEVVVSVSLGVCLSGDDADDAATLLKYAGAALSHARKQGNNCQFYTSDINDEALNRLAIERDLRTALDRGEFEMLYQPKIDGLTARVTGVEALIRWHHPELGLISPFDFITIAEETGLIVPIGEWIVRNVCTQCRSWHDRGLMLEAAINLSPRQLENPDLAPSLLAIIAETGFDPRYLNLEVTETSIMHSAESAIASLRELQATGIKISIDDFGTGYSSLGYLKELPVDVLKIDKSFLNNVTSNPDDAALVMAIITLAHNLRLKVVAEGVETQEQLNLLHLLRCDEWQGYLFSKPVSTEAIEHLVTGQAA